MALKDKEFTRQDVSKTLFEGTIKHLNKANSALSKAHTKSSYSSVLAKSTVGNYVLSANILMSGDVEFVLNKKLPNKIKGNLQDSRIGRVLVKGNKDIASIEYSANTLTEAKALYSWLVGLGDKTIMEIRNGQVKIFD